MNLDLYFTWVGDQKLTGYNLKWPIGEITYSSLVIENALEQ